MNAEYQRLIISKTIIWRELRGRWEQEQTHRIKMGVERPKERREVGKER